MDCLPGDGIAQCDPRNPFPNGECLGFTSNAAFGTLDNTTSFDPDWGGRVWDAVVQLGVLGRCTARGDRRRLAELHLLPAHLRELRRRPITHFKTPRTSTSTVSRCPTIRGCRTPGEQRCGYYDINSPILLGQIDQVRSSASDFGEHKRHWNGVDVTVNARMDNSLLLQGGFSTGRKSEDDCDLNANLNNPSGSNTISRVDCSQVENFQTQVKLLGSYTLPHGIQIAATLQSLPGTPIGAAVSYSAANTTLGRAFSGGATKNLQVLDRGTEYAERLLQVDLRLTKLFDFGASRVRAMFDMYNLFNESTVMEFNNRYGSTLSGGVNWLAPQLLIPGRLVKFAFQLDF